MLYKSKTRKAHFRSVAIENGMMAAKSVIRSISIVIFILCRLYIFSVECKWIPPCQKVVNGEIDSVPSSSDSIYLTRDLNDCNCGSDSELSQIGYVLVPVSYLTAGDENAENLKAILMDNAIHKIHPNELAPDGPQVQEVPLIRDGPPIQDSGNSGNAGLENNSKINPNTSLETPETTMVKINNSINEDLEKNESTDNIKTNQVNPFYQKVQDIVTSWRDDENSPSPYESDDDVVKLINVNPKTSTPARKTPNDQSKVDDDLVGGNEDTNEGDNEASNAANPESDSKDDKNTPTDDDQDTDSEEDKALAKVDLSDDDLNIDDDEDDDNKRASNDEDDDVKKAGDNKKAVDDNKKAPDDDQDTDSEEDDDLAKVDLSDDDLNIDDDEDDDNKKASDDEDDVAKKAGDDKKAPDGNKKVPDDDEDTDSKEDEDLAKVDLSDDDLNIDDDEDDDNKKASDDEDDDVKKAGDNKKAADDDKIAPEDANVKWQEDLAKYKLDMCSNIVSYQTKLLHHVLHYMDYIKEKMDQQRPPAPAAPIFNQAVVYPSYNQNYVLPAHDHHHHLGLEQNPSFQSAPFESTI